MKLRQGISSLGVYLNCRTVVFPGTWEFWCRFPESLSARSEFCSMMVSVSGENVRSGVVQSGFDLVLNKKRYYNFQDQGYFMFTIIFFFPSCCSSIYSLCSEFHKRPDLDSCCWLFKQGDLWWPCYLCCSQSRTLSFRTFLIGIQIWPDMK